MPSANLQYQCPFCDSVVFVGKPCPGCTEKSASKGLKKRSWEQSKLDDGLDIPNDEDFDYDEFVSREFGRTPHLKIGIAWYWWTLAILLMVAMTVGLVASC